ncbi:MAG: hemolysin family protein [Candidatus Zixiibacteriota bacterium]
MDSLLALEIGAIVILILANGFFALSEFSVIASRKTKLRQKVDEGKFGAATASRLHDNPEGFLATIQVGITLVGALVGVFSGATIVASLEKYYSASSITFVANGASALAVLTVVVPITILSVVLGELVPKYVALSYPEKYARLVAGPINLFYKTTYVFARVLSGVARLIVRLLGVRRDPETGVISEEEVEHIIVEGRKRGLFEITEEEFIKSVFAFTDSTVRRAMKPRTDVIGIAADASPQEAMKIIAENGYSRYPVYENTVDHVVGVLYTKDLLTDLTERSQLDVRKLMRDPVFVPDSMPLTRVLHQFQRGKAHLAVVLDEFGGTAGIVTLEDILEELVGEIQDEYDAEAPPVLKLSETVVHADGSVWPGEVNELLGTKLPEEEAETIAGLFIDEAGRVPDRYESVQLADAKLTVLAKDKNRIMRMKVEKLGSPEEGE